MRCVERRRTCIQREFGERVYQFCVRVTRDDVCAFRHSMAGFDMDDALYARLRGGRKVYHLVADHDRRCEAKIEVGSRLEKHAGIRLAPRGVTLAWRVSICINCRERLPY